jgi:ABC-type uncharacterized transport system ATPase subunit
LLGICDRIYTLAYGRITGEVPVAEATQERLMHLMTMERGRPETAAVGAGSDPREAGVDTVPANDSKGQQR